jgi:hypothetical protein
MSYVLTTRGTTFKSQSSVLEFKKSVVMPREGFAPNVSRPRFQSHPTSTNSTRESSGIIWRVPHNETLREIHPSQRTKFLLLGKCDGRMDVQASIQVCGTLGTISTSVYIEISDSMQYISRHTSPGLQRGDESF